MSAPLRARAQFKTASQVLVLIAFGCLAGCVSKPQKTAEPPPQASNITPLKADRVLVFKERRKLYLMRGDNALASFPIALGRNPIGPKTKSGDERTPEGLYVLDWRNPNSRYHRSIHISYPNHEDIVQARKNHVSPGGDIMIHGLPNGEGEIGARHLVTDWTDGCIAVTNEQMDVIWHMVDDNTPIEIRP